jgi:myo-inositol-1(or 4)-monophosphatase
MEVSSVGAGGDKTILADSEAERVALDCVMQTADVRVISEELGTAGRRNARWLVLVDPIDGSSNYQRGIPFYCTSFAVTERDSLDSVRYALIWNLVNGEVYWAEKGKGAMKGDRPIAATSTANLGEALVTIDTCRITEEKLLGLSKLITSVKRQVHLGANALELCYLAEGRTDAFVDYRGRMRITDFAGGYLIAREAGAVVSSVDGTKLSPKMDLKERFSFVASSNKTLHKQVLSLLG